MSCIVMMAADRRSWKVPLNFKSKGSELGDKSSSLSFHGRITFKLQFMCANVHASDLLLYLSHGLGCEDIELATLTIHINVINVFI